MFKKKTLCPEGMGISVLKNGKINRDMKKKEMKKILPLNSLPLKVYPLKLDMAHKAQL